MPPEMHESPEQATPDASESTNTESVVNAQPDRAWYIQRIIGLVLALVAGFLLALALVPILHPEVEITRPDTTERAPTEAPLSDLEKLQNLPPIEEPGTEPSEVAPADAADGLEQLRAQPPIDDPAAEPSPNTGAGNTVEDLQNLPSITEE
ncbi:MAG: hypothetical protein ACOC4E_02475 [Patescibacteria group bacterium]